MGGESKYKCSRSHDHDGYHAHIYINYGKTFSYRTYIPMIMELAMEIYERKPFIVYINDDLELTMTYFTAMSNLAKLAFVLMVSPDIR